MTLRQTTNYSKMVTRNQKIYFAFTFYEKTFQKSTIKSRLDDEPQMVISTTTKHNLTTKKNRIVHRKINHDPLPFEQTTVTSAKCANTRSTT